MAEFRPTRREINRAKILAELAESYAAASKNGKYGEYLQKQSSELSAMYSARAFALAAEITARNQERTK